MVGTSSSEAAAAASAGLKPCNDRARGAVGGAAAGASSPPTGEARRNMKLFVAGALAMSTMQNVFFSTTVRLARRQDGGHEYSDLSVAIVNEAVKLAIALLVILWTTGMRGLAVSLHKLVCLHLTASMRLSIPGMLYIVQNWLVLVGNSNLSTCLYVVSKQLVVLTTAVTWVILMRKPIGGTKAGALFVLVAGVCSISMQGDTASRGNMPLGLGAVVTACFTSSFACVYLEMMFKEKVFDLWESNVVLSTFGVLLGGATVLFTDSNDMRSLRENGMTYGYTPAVWLVVFLQSAGGFLTAVILKYSDSVTKVVSKALAVVAGAVCSRLFYGEGPTMDTPRFWFGMSCTVLGVLVYGLGVGWIFEPLRRCLPRPAEATGTASASTNDLARQLFDSTAEAAERGAAGSGGSGSKGASTGKVGVELQLSCPTFSPSKDRGADSTVGGEEYSEDSDASGAKAPESPERRERRRRSECHVFG